MRVAFAKHWLEDAIAQERDPALLVQSIASHPEFLKTIEAAVAFAKRETTDPAQQTRYIAEHIASVLHQSMGDYTTSH
jgi:hypothetical protein